MKRYWEQLKPGERRMVAGIGLIFFLVLNWIFVWPHLHDLGKAGMRMDKAHVTIDLYKAELKNKPTYEAKIRALQSDGASDVQAEDQALDFVRFYDARARSNSVQVINNSRLITSTNDPFFVDHEMSLTVQGKERNIVNFLYSLGSGNFVRVRGMSLHPDGPHQQINANISIVASYAKKPPARTTAPAAAPARTAADTAAPKTAATNKPLVTVSRKNADTNKPVPLTAKRP